MSEKKSFRSNDTANPRSTNRTSSGHNANKEFNQWWEHWMSKVPHNRLSAKNTVTKNAPNKFEYLSELDETIKEKDAA
jgi:hypothetical protein